MTRNPCMSMASPVYVPAVLGALAVWRLSTKKKKDSSSVQTHPIQPFPSGTNILEIKMVSFGTD